MSIGMRLSLRQSIKCTVCRRVVSDEAAQSTAVSAKLFGAAAYSVCPSCGMEGDPTNASFRARVDKFLKENPMSERCEVCGPTSEELSGAAGECTTVALSTTNGFSVKYVLCQEHAETVIHHLGYVIGRLAQPEEEPSDEQSGTKASG